eukprot:18544-Heterococcus_DN1.PRE.2
MELTSLRSSKRERIKREKPLGPLLVSANVFRMPLAPPRTVQAAVRAWSRSQGPLQSLFEQTA